MNKLNFNNGKFRILQISDVQDLIWIRKACVELIGNAIDLTSPDLIIFTGDNLLGNHICDPRFGSKRKNYSHKEQLIIIKETLDKFLSIPESKKVPFAVIFGNHDDMNDVSKDEQCDIFRSYKMNVGSETKGELAGNYTIDVCGKDGEIKLIIWNIDTSRHSGYNEHDDNYGNVIMKSQVDWFKSSSEKLNNVPGIMFLHVPLQELSDFVAESDSSDYDCKLNGKYYKLNREKAFGELNEPVESVNEENGFYDEILRQNNIIAIVSGHDHTNNFEGVKDNIRFIQSPAASFRSYGNSERGVRVFDFYEDDVINFNTFTLNYFDVCGRNIKSKIRYFLDADGLDIQRAAVFGFSLLSAAAVSAKVIKKFIVK